MKVETIEYLRSLVRAEAKRPGSGQDFHKLMNALRELDVAEGVPLPALTDTLVKLHEEECWGESEGAIFNTGCAACIGRLKTATEAQEFLRRSVSGAAL